MPAFKQKHYAPTIIVVSAILACIYLYLPGLYGPIVLDDWSNLSRLLGQETTLKNAFTEILSESGPLARPVSMLSFIANSLAGHELFHWKLTNLIIHIITGYVIYLLTTRLLPSTNNENKVIAAFVAAIWIIHPLHVSTVLYTVQRMTQLSALFVFTSLLVYLEARTNQIHKRPHIHLQLLAWCILFPLGFLSKENALLFPLYVLLLELYVLQKDNIDNKTVTIGFVLIATIAAFSLVPIADSLERLYMDRNFSMRDRLLTEGRVVTSYIGMIMAPALERMGFMHDGIAPSRGLLQPLTTLPSITFLFTLICTGVLIRKKLPVIGFGILFFFSGHLIESTVLPLELKFEHRNYLPSFGIILATAVALRAAIKNTALLSSIGITIALLFVFVLFLRTDIWSSSYRLYYHIATTHPESERHAAAQARQYAAMGEYDEARNRIAEFASIGARLQKLHIDCIENQTMNISDLYSLNIKGSALDNYFMMELTDIANLGLDEKCIFSKDGFLMFLSAVSEAEKIKNKNLQIALIYKAHYAQVLNKDEEAMHALERSYSLDKTNPTPLFLGCEWILDGKIEDASSSICEKAIQVSESDPIKKYRKLEERIKHKQAK